MDSDAFQRLKDGSDQDISLIYPSFQAAFVNYITNAFRCPIDRAVEIYPEAFSIVYFNIKKGKLTAPLKSSIQTYLNSTGWNLYHRRYLDKYNREKLPIEHAVHAIDTEDIVDEALMQHERAVFVKSMLESIGDPCRTILMHIYFHETAYKELANNMNVPENTLRKRKFDCLSKMRKLMAENNLEL